MTAKLLMIGIIVLFVLALYGVDSIIERQVKNKG